MNADLTRQALIESVRKAWDINLTRPVNDAVDIRQAQIAVSEIVYALRMNPAWCKSLGIGQTGDEPSGRVG